MNRQFPITVYVQDHVARIYGAGERKPNWVVDYNLLGTYETAEALGAAMLAWAMGSKS